MSLEETDMHSIMQKAITRAQKKSTLDPVFLKRESFAGTAVSTSSLWLDYILGGGIPPSRIIAISGPERAGKSLLVTDILRNQLEAKRYGFYFDAEGSTDPLFLANRGIHFDKYIGQRTAKGNLKKGQVDYLHYYQPSNDNEFKNYISEVASALPENRNPTAPPALFLLDSVVALIPEAVLEDVNKNSMASHARMYSSLMPIVNAYLARTGCSFIYTNQLRSKPGVQYGSPLYEPCGDTLKFFSSIRMRLSQNKPKLDLKPHPFVNGFVPKGEWKQDGVWQEPHPDGGLDKYVYTGIRTDKNKAYTPYQICWMRIHFEENGQMGTGLDPVFDIFSFLADLDLIKPVGPATAKTYGVVENEHIDLVKVIGLPKQFDYVTFKGWVKENPAISKVIRDKIIVSGLAFNMNKENTDEGAEPAESEEPPSE